MAPYLPSSTLRLTDAAKCSKCVRFNVDRGLDITLLGWEQDTTAPVHTRSCLSEQTRTIEKPVDVFTWSASSIDYPITGDDLGDIALDHKSRAYYIIEPFVCADVIMVQ
ncbi:calcium-independent phospholipase A2-gamma [Penicillium hispanicum]|uniref:calcium-independent phospholipase A2-gamma n=1 Tax=Penicillium hispanicum TaxID=1080232 RepID=UPI0025407D59|nr:calcium-independent phospholipase A2-gamma [Penicillium hispanicum]KAJ5585243.1 calcium-independent phospholipase A2-gamma [Penicillium hispanicum]